jgi:hypothetical protein
MFFFKIIAWLELSPNEMKAWAFNLNVSFQYSQMEGKRTLFCIMLCFLSRQIKCFYFFPSHIEKLNKCIQIMVWSPQIAYTSC